MNQRICSLASVFHLLDKSMLTLKKLGSNLVLWLRVCGSMRVVILLSTFIVLNACNGTNKFLAKNSSPDSSSPSATTFQLFTDIPIPPGTSFDTENSLILGSGEGWTGRLIIKLSKSPSEAFAIYTTEMPQFGWKPIASIQSETSVLTFTRSDRAATLEIESRAISGSIVRITMTPQPKSNP